MDKYKNGKIYTIRYKNDDSLIYVGSTCQPLYKRWSQHKSHSKKTEKENIQLYIKMNDTDVNDWYIELYEDCSCERKEQLLKREGQVIREIGTLNRIISGRTNKEWSEDNKEKMQEYKKEWAEDNKEKIKEYNENNKGEKKEYNKQYKEANKEKINEYASANILCECGCRVSRLSIAKHKRSPKHAMIMKELAKTQEQTI